ncbi:MAG TPA: hypothetical protein DCF45_11345 [Gammaproteobacteria bacterium]|nr:hypothetical protein [Gammaproteobacteria bacterium]
MSTLFNILSLTGYAIICGMAFRQIFGKRKKKNTPRPPDGLILLTIALHTFVIFYLLTETDGLNLNLANTLSVTALVTVIIFWLTSVQNSLDGFYIVVMPIAALCCGITLIPTGVEQAASMTAPLLTHVLLSVIAYGVLAVASLQALFMAYIDRQIRYKRSGPLLEIMPPLQQLETLLFRYLLVGLLLLTASLASGFGYMEDMFAQHVAHKTAFSVIAWLLLTVLMLGHHFFGWRGRIAIRFSLIAFVLLLIGFIGSKFVLEVVLNNPV